MYISFICFFKVASSNNNANSSVTINGANLCMSLQLSSSNVTLSNEYAVPVSDAKALSSDVYKTEVTIENNCGDAQSFNLLLVPNSSNTMPIKALKYTLTEKGVTPTSGTLITNEYILDSTIQKQLLSIKSETLKNGFSVGSGTVNANTTKTFNLYLWIDKDEGNLGNGSTMDKILNAYLTLGSGTTIGELKPDLYHTIENRYNQDKTYLGLYTGEGADTYANPVYYYKGNVENNNVLFGGFCWKIVRTTETGGVKIVYNGTYKDYTEDLTLLDESEYTNLTNDANYPYTFDSTNKTWTSTNTGTNSSSIAFTAPSNGNYVLNYDSSMYDWQDYIYVEIFKDDVSQGKFAGTTTGQIIFGDLDTSNTIKVVFTRKSSSTSGSRNNVIFSLSKGNNIYKTCNNTGTDSQIGRSTFNSDSAYNIGYMYNTLYSRLSKYIISSASLSGTTTYGDGVTYANGKYALTNTTTLDVSSSNISTLVGKYICNGSSTLGTCSAGARYIVGYSGTTIYNYYLSEGVIDGTTLANKDYVFGSSFTYANGSYSLSDTVTLNSDTFIANSSNVNTHHYTCLSNKATCSSIYYIYGIYDGTLHYITLTGGKSVNDALNEMLYADDVNTKDSTIKAYIDNWYENNLIDYEAKLEDTVFCNDRSISSLGGWNPYGGSITSNLYFANGITTRQSLVCVNETDRFSMSNAKAILKHPIGLLSLPELNLSRDGSNNYLYNGQDFLVGSPNRIYGNEYGACYITYICSSGGWCCGSTNSSNGVRPSVSLKPGTEPVSGDGSFTKPFVIE